MSNFKDRILQASLELFPELEKLSDDIYYNPELGYEEHKASSWHIALLEKYGFTVERSFCSITTGFRGIYDSGKPGLTIAYLVEYDALPDIGHGCGHNILSVASTGAGILLSRVLNETGGRIYVFGTPAEETDGAKVAYANAGMFDDVDIAMMSHPESGYYRSGTTLAMSSPQFEFSGKATHASTNPEDGINAMNAAILTINAINALREHTRYDSRIHGIVVDGGKAPNIVPEYAILRYYVRSTSKSYNEKLLERVKNCARAGALATGCQLDISLFEQSVDNLVTNEALMDVFDEVMFDLTGIKMKLMPDMGSSDVGAVSQVCPTIQPYFDITQYDKSILNHTREFAESTLTPYAKEQMRLTAAALALTGTKALTDPDLFQKINAEFLQFRSSES